MSTAEKNWQRARKPGQKALRRDEILEAAKRLFSSKSYEEVSLNSIAREAGMSKPNVYRYFASKEEIFLCILSEEQQRFVEAIQKRLENLSSASVDDIVEVWVEQSLSTDNLNALLPQLGLSMEKNSSVEQLVAYKKEAFHHMKVLAVQHHALYPRLKIESWAEVISLIFVLKSGLWPLCQNGETVMAAMQHPEVDQQPWDFASKMRFALKSLIEGAS